MTGLNTDPTADARVARAPVSDDHGVCARVQCPLERPRYCGYRRPMLVRRGSRSAPLFRHAGHNASCRSGAVGLALAASTRSCPVDDIRQLE